MTRTNVTDFYSTTLTAPAVAGSTAFPVASLSGAPPAPTRIVLNPRDPQRREIVLCDLANSGSQFNTSTAANRNQPGSSGNLDHDPGDEVWVSWLSADAENIYDEIDALSSATVKRDGSQAMQAALPMGGFKVTGLGAPTADTDAARKSYVDAPGITSTSANYTLSLTDAGKAVHGTSGSARTITVPPNSSVAFPVGTVIILYRAGAGALTVAAGAGVTIRQANGAFALDGQYAEATLRKIATDEWVLSGALT